MTRLPLTLGKLQNNQSALSQLGDQSSADQYAPNIDKQLFKLVADQGIMMRSCGKSILKNLG